MSFESRGAEAAVEEEEGEDEEEAVVEVVDGWLGTGFAEAGGVRPFLWKPPEAEEEDDADEVEG